MCQQRSTPIQMSDVFFRAVPSLLKPDGQHMLDIFLLSLSMSLQIHLLLCEELLKLPSRPQSLVMNLHPHVSRLMQRCFSFE